MARKVIGIVYDTKNNRTRARETVTLLDGSKERFEAYGDTKEQAAAKLREKVEALNEVIMYGKRKQDGDVTLAEAVADKIKERRAAYDRDRGREEIRDTTADRDDDVYESLLLPYPIAQKKLNKIFFPDCEQYRVQLENAQYDKRRTKKEHEPVWCYYSASTLNRIIRLVVEVLDEYYKRSPYKSPTSALPLFKQSSPKKTEEDFLMGDEVPHFISHCEHMREMAKYRLDGTCADLFIVAVLSGLRPGELLGLQVRDYDEEQASITVQRTGAYEDGRAKTEASLDTVFLVPKAVDILSRRCKGLKKNALVFPSTKGNTIMSESNMLKKFKRWVREAGIDKNLRTHSLRGSCASYMFDIGCSAEDVMVQLRHSKIDTAMKYYIARGDKRKKDIRQKMTLAFETGGGNTYVQGDSNSAGSDGA